MVPPPPDPPLKLILKLEELPDPPFPFPELQAQKWLPILTISSICSISKNFSFNHVKKSVIKCTKVSANEKPPKWLLEKMFFQKIDLPLWGNYY